MTPHNEAAFLEAVAQAAERSLAALSEHGCRRVKAVGIVYLCDHGTPQWFCNCDARDGKAAAYELMEGLVTVLTDTLAKRESAAVKALGSDDESIQDIVLKGPER